MPNAIKSSSAETAPSPASLAARPCSTRSFLLLFSLDAMGIKSLIKELPGGTMGESLIGFSKLPPAAAGERRVVDIDTGGLVYVCAHRCKETFNRGDSPSSATR